MKIVFGLLLVGLIAIFAMYKSGMFTVEDPAAVKDMMYKTVKPGMTWVQVANIREPRRMMQLLPESVTGKGAEMPFERDNVEHIVKNNRFPDGFVFEYYFSNANAVQVVFDGKGVVDDVQDLMTMNDLLDSPDFGR